MTFKAVSPTRLIDEKNRMIWNEGRYHICYDDGKYVYWFGVESNPEEIAFYGQDFKAIARDGNQVEISMDERKRLFDEIAKELPQITSQRLEWVILPVRG
jgi:hypothetical protein